MKVDDCFYLGYISKSIGTKGELAFKLDVDSPSSYLELESVMVQAFPTDTQLIPYFIKQISLQNNGSLRVRLEDVDDQAAAKNLIGKSLFLPLAFLPKLKDQQFYFHEIIGYSVFDAEKGELGAVEKVIEYSTSNLIAVKSGEKEILIPISDETIERIDKADKKLFVRCPEGLIDLYLE